MKTYKVKKPHPVITGAAFLCGLMALLVIVCLLT